MWPHRCRRAVLPAAAAEATWKIQIWGPKRASLVPFEWYTEQVTAKTNGQIKFDVAFDKGKVTDAVELLNSGAADGTFVCTQFFSEKMRLLTLIDLPLLTPEQITAVKSGSSWRSGSPGSRGELRKSNIRMMLPTPLPQAQFMGTRRLTKIEDFQGAKVRISPEMGKILGEYGAKVIATSTAEAMRQAREEGKLDLVALPYPMHSLRTRWTTPRSTSPTRFPWDRRFATWPRARSPGTRCPPM